MRAFGPFLAQLLLLSLGCATSHKLEAHEEATLHEEHHSEASGEKHEGPWTEKIYTFAPPEEVMPSEPEPERIRSADPNQHGLSVAQGVAGDVAHGPLLSLTVREHSGDTEAWRASGSGLSGAEVRLETVKTDTMAPAGGCMLGLGFYGAMAIAGLCLAGGLYLKWRR